MSGICRLCNASTGEERQVSVGDGVTRDWLVCDDCVSALRETGAVTVAEDGSDTSLRIECQDLMAELDPDRT